MTIAYLFPGQGSQAVGMGKDLFDRSPEAKGLFLRADEVLGFPLSKLCFEGPEEELRLTRNAQPALLVVSTAACRLLGRDPAVAAGPSLGEYSALVSAGSLSFPDVIRLVRRRGVLMEEAVPAGPGTMAAVLGMELEAVEAVCREAAAAVRAVVDVANINCPGQIVISGGKDAVLAAMDLFKKAGARRVIPLAVSGPFPSGHQVIWAVLGCICRIPWASSMRP